MKNKRWIIAGVVLIILASAIGIYFKFSNPPDFKITPDYPIKMNLVPGTEAKTSIKITNNEKETNNFQIKLDGLSEIALLSESEFFLEPKESKEIEITFSDSQNVSHIYFANLIVISGGFKKYEPVLLTFEEPVHLFTILQKPMPKYFNVYPGGKLGVDIAIFDLGAKNYGKEIKLNYEISSPEKIIFSSDENLVLNDEISFSKIFDINPELSYGDYVLVTSAEYNGIKSISSYLFKVAPKPNGVFFDKINFLILIFLAFVILIVVLFIYFIKSRDELLLQLRKQQSKELAKNIELIASIQKKVSAVKKEKLERVKKRVIKKIEKKQEKQIKELTKLRKRKVKKNALQTQIKKWGKEGYEFPEIRREIPEKSVNKQIIEWRKKGFDTGALS